MAGRNIILDYFPSLLSLYWRKNKTATADPPNIKYNKWFQKAIRVALNDEDIVKSP